MFPLFLQFLVHKWMLATAWVAVLYMIVFYESRKSGKPVTPQQLSDMVNRQEALVLDVRDHNDFRQGHITGSLNIPLRDLERRLAEMDAYRDKPVIVVCKMGQSAGTAVRQLREKGFALVFKLGGGITEWTASNLPLVK